MNYSEGVKQALNYAWHQETAVKSLQRWTELLDREGWHVNGDSLALMTRLFGASWYFTRFMFLRGAKVIPLFDAKRQHIESVENNIALILEFPTANDPDVDIKNLRIKKNECMLLVLLLQLADVIQQQEAERLLTCIADNVFMAMFRLYELDKLEETQCIVLGMGRFAGEEMNFGSDLDLIFIEKVMEGTGYEKVSSKIRKLLRQFSRMDPSGTLYQFDMRLRPHGTAGTLVSPLDSFIDFHKGKRDVWERQMMTRCRFICGDKGLSSQLQKDIADTVYQPYDQTYLASEIMKMRLLVEQELAGGQDNIELKRGRGGIMDIDFLMHFFQLSQGHTDPLFRQTSTRRLIAIANQKRLLNDKAAVLLLDAYNFYKKSELALRVFDMKSTSKVTMDNKALLPLARANGFISADKELAVKDYLEKLFVYRDWVRSVFDQVLIDAG